MQYKTLDEMTVEELYEAHREVEHRYLTATNQALLNEIDRRIEDFADQGVFARAFAPGWDQPKPVQWPLKS